MANVEVVTTNLKRYKNLAGNTYGRLTAVKPLGKDKDNNVVWLFNCSCGSTYINVGAWITSQHRKANNSEAPSCGCLNKETTKILRLKHGMTKHPLFWVWSQMVERCHNPNHPSYPKYGAKGVRVCEEWRRDSKAFMEWALANGWEQGLHLDKDILCTQLGISPRIYSADTCQFIEPKLNSSLTSRYGKLEDYCK